jgi:heme oxygenase
MSPPLPSRSPCLSRQLRTSTRLDHERAEAAFGLDVWTRDRASYGRLLLALRTFHAPAEQRLRGGLEWGRLRPPVHVRARERTHLLTRDLRHLGVDSPSPLDEPALPEPLTTSLGWLYVLEGSRLGGVLITGRARAALGDDLPVAFFSGDDRSPGADWRALQQALDAFGATAGTARRAEVVAAARLAFAAFRECLTLDEALR